MIVTTHSADPSGQSWLQAFEMLMKQTRISGFEVYNTNEAGIENEKEKIDNSNRRNHWSTVVIFCSCYHRESLPEDQSVERATS